MDIDKEQENKTVEEEKKEETLTDEDREIQERLKRLQEQDPFIYD